MIDTISLALLLPTFAAWANRQQATVIVYPIEVNRVLEEQQRLCGGMMAFRGDLYYRLSGERVVIPRLRDRVASGERA